MSPCRVVKSTAPGRCIQVRVCVRGCVLEFVFECVFLRDFSIICVFMCVCLGEFESV